MKPKKHLKRELIRKIIALKLIRHYEEYLNRNYAVYISKIENGEGVRVSAKPIRKD